MLVIAMSSDQAETELKPELMTNLDAFKIPEASEPEKTENPNRETGPERPKDSMSIDLDSATFEAVKEWIVDKKGLGDYWLSNFEERIGGDIWREYSSRQGYSGVMIKPFHALLGFVGWVGITRLAKLLKSRKSEKGKTSKEPKTEPESSPVEVPKDYPQEVPMYD